MPGKNKPGAQKICKSHPRRTFALHAADQRHAHQSDLYAQIAEGLQATKPAPIGGYFARPNYGQKSREVINVSASGQPEMTASGQRRHSSANVLPCAGKPARAGLLGRRELPPPRPEFLAVAPDDPRHIIEGFRR